MVFILNKDIKFYWYVIQVFSGQENKIAESISQAVIHKSYQDSIKDIVVPEEEVESVIKGKKVLKRIRFLPGYIMLNMKKDDKAIEILNTVFKVNSRNANMKLSKISDKEAENILSQIQNGTGTNSINYNFTVGSEIKVKEGPFASFIGLIDSIDEGKKKMKVNVTIFGRATSLDLNYDQVEKIEQ